ncbi:MAG: membrane protein insertion efficiency factor YidD [Actinobacteria bacterium]|jgi:putative membrane protein insertion efficiency factor|nr:membrane protein insertion efficiency factor YidD [Actinomycetota bacterium]
MIGDLAHGLYAHVLRPLWPGGAPATRNCRFEPTCSRYAIDAVRYRGPFVGPVLAVWRLLRCNPWNDGGNDPVRRRPD